MRHLILAFGLLAACDDCPDWQIDLPLVSQTGDAGPMPDRLVMQVLDPCGHPRLVNGDTEYPAWTCSPASGAVRCDAWGGDGVHFGLVFEGEDAATYFYGEHIEYRYAR